MSCAASWSPPCATTPARCWSPASSADRSTTAPSACGPRATGPTASSSGSRRSSVAPCSSRGSGASSTRSWLADGEGDPSPLLEAWAGRARARPARARTTAPYQVGWCSWYHYFHGVTEADLRANLARAADWPFDVFQLDDGFQPAIGDWLTTNEKFPTPRRRAGRRHRRRGAHPGHLDRAVPRRRRARPWRRAHPDWLAVHAAQRHPAGRHGQRRPGVARSTRSTRANPRCSTTSRASRERWSRPGYPYLKLDFTYAPSIRGGYADPGPHAGAARAGRLRRDPARRGRPTPSCSAAAPRWGQRWGWSTACASAPTSRRGGTRRTTSTDRRATRAASRPR